MLALLITATTLLLLYQVNRLRSPIGAPLLAAVALSAVLGGVGPGLASAALAALALQYWSVPPVGSFAAGAPEGVVRGLIFLASAVLIAGIGGAAHRGRRRAEEHAREAERLRAEAERSAERFRLAARAVIGTLYEYDLQQGSVTRSEGLHELIGYHPDQVPHTVDWWIAQIHPDDRASLSAAIGRAPASSGMSLRYRVRHREGRWLYVDDRAVVLKDIQGRPLRLVGFTTDVTEVVTAEAALREGARQLRLVTDNVPVRIAHCDAEWRYKFVNRAYAERFGLTAEQVIGKRIPEVVGAEAFAITEPYLRRTLGGEETEFEIEFPYVTGTAVMRCALVPERNGNGEVVGVLSAVMDITERKRMEEALRLSERRLAAILQQLPVGIGVMDRNGSWTLSNELLRAHMSGMIPSRDPAAVAEWRATGADGRPIPPEEWPGPRALRGEVVIPGLEMVHRTGDGREVWLLESAAPLRDEAGEIIGATVVIEDVDRERRQREQLRESEERYRSLFSAINEGFALKEAVRDEEGRIVDFRFLEVNPAFEAQTGLSQVVGRTMREVMPNLEPTWIESFERVVRTGTPARFQERVAALDRWFEVFSSRVGGPGSLRVVVLVSDITDRKRAEDALRSADRMEAVGRLAGGVAHEANNQMTVVLGCASFAMLHPEVPAEVRQELLNIQRAGERTAVITSQLLAFSRRQVLQPAPLDLNEVVEGFVPILRRTLGAGCDIALALHPRMEKVLADRGQIEQVLVNLTFNARDAMPRGGRVTIGTGLVSLAEPRRGSDPAEPLPAGRYGLLTVRDTGHGMTPETLGRIFEPFFTTKPPGQGTGLGLSTVYGIVRQLGGDIAVESAPGAGTALTIYLPLAPAQPAAVDTAPRETSRPAAGTVLVVEDEPQVRALAARALRAAGYEVLEAEHGGHALEVLARHPGTVQAVVSDVAMPVMAGRELAERLARLEPGLPLLLTSGYTADELVRRGLLASVSEPLLPKPYAPEVLVERVRALVDGRMARV